MLDADIKGFFDNLDQEWLMEFLGHDIADKNFLRYVSRFLKSGIMEDGTRLESDRGTPKGGQRWRDITIIMELVGIFMGYRGSGNT